MRGIIWGSFSCVTETQWLQGFDHGADLLRRRGDRAIDGLSR